MQNVHPLTIAREARHLSQLELAEAVGLGARTIWAAEHYEPISADSRRRLCRYFKKSAEELGLVKAEARKRERLQGRASATAVPALADAARESPSPPVSQPEPSTTASAAAWSPSTVSALVPSAHVQAAGLLAAPGAALEQQAAAWLTLGTAFVGQLFDAGMSLDAILESLRVVLQSAQGMPAVTRRQLLQIGVAAALNGISFPAGERISAEEQTSLAQGLGQSIASSWKLFLSASNTQVLAIGQAQLAILQQTHAFLPPLARPFLYAGVYGLLGITLDYRGCGEEAIQAHQSSYIAALATGDRGQVAQSLLRQANSYHVQDRYAEAIQSLEEALRVVGDSVDEAMQRTKAHALACWADAAISMKDFSTAREKLDASVAYLEQLGSHEQFDRTNWLQIEGRFALALGNYEVANQHFDTVLAQLPSTWLLRRVYILLPMWEICLHRSNRDGCLELANSIASLLNSINSPYLGRMFSSCLYN